MKTHSAPQTILEYFLKWEAEMPNGVFLKQPYGNTYKEYTWKKVGEEARKVLGALQKRGYQPGDKIALLSSNCAYWMICDIAILMGGFISIPMYADVNAKTMRQILEHSESKFLFVGKLKDSDWHQFKDAIPKNIETACLYGYNKEGVESWEDFISETGDAEPHPTGPEEVITYIYTSGTTGNPKGVVHTNNSILNAIETAAEAVKLKQRGNRFVSYLPLCHAAERGLIEGGGIYSGGTISFVETLESFAQNVQDHAPTHFFGVPRIWEKIQGKILEKLPQKRLNLLLSIPIISTLIKNKIKKSIGLHKADVVLSGAAPLSAELIYWYQTIGVNIREAYGMTENFNVLAMNPEDDIRPGTVGKIFDNQEVKIDPDTQEIIQKCSWSMLEYYKEPEITAETLTDGWLHTGDMGKISDDGFLTVTGRVKDIFKTSKGKYISPGVIEVHFTNVDSIEQCCVMGSRYAQPFALVVLSEIGQSKEKRAVESELKDVLAIVNKDAMKHEQIKKVIVVKEEWTNANQLLTPTLKMKRTALSEKYEVALEDLVNSEELVSWE